MELTPRSPVQSCALSKSKPEVDFWMQQLARLFFHLLVAVRVTSEQIEASLKVLAESSCALLSGRGGQF